MAQAARELGGGESDTTRGELRTSSRLGHEPRSVGFSSLPELDADASLAGRKHAHEQRDLGILRAFRNFDVRELELDEASRSALVELDA